MIMIERWKNIKSEEILPLNIFNVVRKTYQRPDTKTEFKANILELSDWVNIVGINEDNQILLIKQFRFGNNKIELEIPGGIMEPGETQKEAAIRELKEETGYKIKKIEQIGQVYANPAFMTNQVYTFLADLSERGSPSLDPNEIIEIEFESLSQVKRYLKSGIISNAYCVLGLFWYIFDEEIQHSG